MGVHRVFREATAFTEAELFEIGYEQAADVVYLAHPSHNPSKMVRYRHDQWLAADVTFATKTDAPINCVATDVRISTPGSFDPITHTYAVTAVDETTGEESLISNQDSCDNDLTITDNYNTVEWDAVTGAEYYNIYKEVNGIWGYIGSAEGLTFSDYNVAPDLSDTAPSNRNPFSDTDDKPACVTFFEQRTVWGRTFNRPSAIYGSQSGNFENMNRSRPAQADDAYEFNLVGRQVNAIRHLVPVRVLLALCDNSVHALSGPNGIITPTDVDIQPQSYRGAGKARPAIVDDVVFFATAKGGSIRTLGYTFERDGYRGNDITVFAPHFFKGRTIIEMAWCEHPTATLWALLDDGTLAALTWQAEQDVWGWSLCDTDGVVESICSITENLEDVLYAVIKRTIGTEELRYIERLATPSWTDVEDAVYLDCARTYSGTPATVISGLDYLEGRTVSALADGAVVTGLVVEDGQITLAVAASKVTVGIPYEAWVQTLPQFPSTQAGSIKGEPQTLTTAVLDVVDTRGIEVAPGKMTPPNVAPTSTNSAYAFSEPNPRTTEAMGDAPNLMNGEVEAFFEGSDFIGPTTVVVRQRNPLPMYVTGIFPDVKMVARGA
jgi:hypothetical protein